MLSTVIMMASSPAVPPHVAKCTSEMDCSLLGSCVDGHCVCQPGWTGASCSVADLEPLDPSLGYQNMTTASWGGRPAWHNGRWHLLVTEIQAACPLILFQYNSRIVRAVSQSDSVMGPYVHAETVLPPFHHNPHLVGPTPDGYYLLFFIGATNASGVLDCTHGVPPSITNGSVPNNPKSPPIYSNTYISMAWTDDVTAPAERWKQRVILRDNRPATDNLSSWHCEESNPAAAVLPNGTVVLAYRARACDIPKVSGEWIGFAIASHWSGDFVHDPTWAIAPEDSNGANNEDPFLWRVPAAADGGPSAAESWHMITHQQSAYGPYGPYGNLCGDRAAGASCGAHWFAPSPHGPWRMSPEPAYSARVVLSNGTVAAYQTRQRPQLIFAADGVTPQYLFNGASFDGDNPVLGILTHTFVQKFRSAPAPEYA